MPKKFKEIAHPRNKDKNPNCDYCKEPLEDDNPYRKHLKCDIKSKEGLQFKQCLVCNKAFDGQEDEEVCPNC